MYKRIIAAFLFFPLTVLSQEKLDVQFIDSLTYQYYRNGEWNKVIALGKKALKQGVDFKYLQQRLGYAYFQKSDYYEAIRYYEHALSYDPLDEGSNLYLYYSGLNIGDQAFARHYAGRLSEDLQEQIGEKCIKPVSSIDFEYNYKWDSEPTRSNPNYVRIGLNSQLGYAVNLYQTMSTYNQSRTDPDQYNDYRSAIRQNEYYVLLSTCLNPKMSFDLGYHYLNAKYDTEIWDLTLNEMTEHTDTLNYPGHLFFGDVRYKWYRFDFGLSASLFNTDWNKTKQAGLHLGMALPGKYGIYVKNSVYFLKDNGYHWTVSKHSIGMLFFKKFWLEGEQTFGNLTNFVDLNGMYIYNSFDSTLSRSGLSLFWYADKRFTFFTNFTLDKKQNYYLRNYYQQKSISGGVIWKF